MQPPAIPENEGQRMAALRATNVLFTPSEERFDRITRLASRLLGTPVSLITLVANDLQWFKSAQGLNAKETPRRDSFCGHAILQDDTFFVRNALQDRRFKDNPLVTGDPFIRAYAGHPLHTTDGSRIGTLCVIDRKPRNFSKEQIQSLRDLAAIAETELERGQLAWAQRALFVERDELKRKEAIDGLTRLWNEAAVMKLLDAELGRARRGAPTCLALIHAVQTGDAGAPQERGVDNAVLVEIAARIRRAVRAFDVAGYCGANEFIVVFGDCDAERAASICERIRSSLDYEHVATPGGLVKATVSIGLASFGAELDTALHIVAAADAALRCAESLGGNRVEIQVAPAKKTAPSASRVGNLRARDFGATDG